MKTSEKTVVVEVKVAGRVVRHTYPIATENGDLMTHRLKRLMAGHVGHSRNPHDAYEDVHFIGMIWRPPYQLLQEISHDRLDLQDQLRACEGKSNFTEAEPAEIPDKAENGKITTMIQDELKMRGLLKARLDRIAAANTDATASFNPEADIRPVAPPYGGWTVTD